MKISAKARDGQGRWRCKTIGVRVSPEENAEIDALAALSGMSKQDYCMYDNYWSILYCMLGLPPVA